MFSILIPTYNYVCTRLVQELARQGEALQTETDGHFRYEIIVGDDGSTDKASIQANRTVNTLSHCHYWMAEKNMGRAAIRNRLAEMATQPYLIYIDSDAETVDGDFLKRYRAAATQAQVVVGGVRNVDRLPSPSVSLRFRYEAAADRKRHAVQRAQAPYLQFSAFNFLIEREQMLRIGFNEQCRHYGYEDAYLGMELARKQISILHIENPLIHLGLDSNETFLHKSETALRTLRSLDEAMRGHAAVSRLSDRMNQLHLRSAVCLFHRLFGRAIRRNLLGPRPSLFLFALYKLGYYTSLPDE